ncbi:hypothetical protein KI688_012484 [Linnemannia hyalina]|uniref:Uncharacterized protein n=1 Tax=Linnemannia hyalina TaxID=64524 RepID=A0A9P7XSY4_9FUNG|nr:hypothetical protein KI688_012484 [Linnemannia hyalina]
MTTDTSATEETKDTKASKVPGPLDKETGKRKKKLDLPVQTGPRRLTPKKMVTDINTKAEVSVEQQEQEEDEIEWIWGCAVEKPAEQDVTQEERDSTSSGHVIKELRVLEVALFQPTCSRHKKNKRKPTKLACRKVKTTSSAQYNGESKTTSTNTEDHMQDRKRSDHAVGDSNNEGNKDGHKEQGRFNGECYDKVKEQEPKNTLVKEDEQRVTEEERKKKLRKRLQKDLEKGLRMQKNLHMKLHSQLGSQKDLELMKAILTELEKGQKLQMMVENELRLKKMQGKGLDKSDLPSAKVYTEDAVATRVLPLLADLQVLAA